MIAWLLAGAVALAEPSLHTVLYYNARMALREDQPVEAVKLWLLRNALEDKTERVSPHDADFGSVTWAALGELGLCADGHPRDTDGAGLWPLALHNWVVRNMRLRQRGRRVRPFDALDVGRQQRYVAIGDVLGTDELMTVRLSRGRCFGHLLQMAQAGEWPLAKLSDRQVTARLLKHLLVRSRETLAADRTTGRAVISARLFDLNLQLAALDAREAERQARQQGRLGRQIGLSSESVDALVDESPDYTFPPDSEPARILRDSAGWSVDEWMALDPERRRFLFDHARAYTGDASLDETVLGILDALITQGDGDEAERWIARYTGPRETIWSGPRGASLLALDDESGFRERAVISLHRGVSELSAGDMPGALRSMAYAMRHAPASREGTEASQLSRRWLSYIAAQFEITESLLVTLQELVPRQDYGIILEDLMWRAAFRADRASFDQGIAGQQGRGALERRLELLAPLSRGDVGRFLRDVERGLEQSPSETLRFLSQLVERLKLEDAPVRSAHIPTMRGLRELVMPLSVGEGGSGRQGRTATELAVETQSIIEGLGGLGDDATDRDRARALGPDAEVFAGSLRLAPADPLPWPFVPEETAAPSVFTPITLRPVEWPDETGGLVFGWSLQG